MRDLVAAFNGPRLSADRLDAGDVHRLLRFSAEHWDFRRGLERHAASDPEYDGTKLGEEILEAAAALGMVHDTEPTGYAYDHVLILGSLLRNCLLRSSFTARLIREHNLSAQEIAALGSSRPVTDVESAQAARLRQQWREFGDVQTEADALEAAVRHEFGLGRVVAEERGSDGSSWRVRTFDLDTTRRLRVVSAPSRDRSRRRANTAVVLDFVKALIWPVLLILVLWLFHRPLRDLLAGVNRISFKAPGVEGMIELATQALERSVDATVRTLAPPPVSRQTEGQDEDRRAAAAPAEEQAAVVDEAARREAIERLLVDAANWGWQVAQLGWERQPEITVSWKPDGRPRLNLGLAPVAPSRGG